MMNQVNPDSASLPCPIAWGAREEPERLALRTPGASYSYRGLDERVRARERYLREHGVAAGERVAIRGPNGVDHVEWLWACWRLGATACLLSTRVPPDALPGLMAQVAAQHLITPEDRAETLSGVQRHAWTAGLSTQAEASASVVLRPEAPAVVVFTSGSTGTPKAALLSIGNLAENARGSNLNLPVAPGDRWLLSLPLYHVGGLGIVWRTALAGAAVVLPGPGPLSEEIQAQGVTHVSMVSTQLVRALQEGVAARLQGVRGLLLGGSAIPSGLLEAALEAGLPVHTTYGLTEMGSQVTTTPPGASAAVLRSSGRLLEGRALRVEGGEILVRGATRFLGYVEGHTVRRPFDDAGWFRTGDLGQVDADGYLHVRGRLDNRFISGGENIHPEEIERALSAQPGVAEAVVVPVSDAEFGQRPVAFVRMLDPAVRPPSSLLQALRAVLPGYKVPDALLPWPLEPGLKPSRPALQAQAERSREDFM
ncbi:MAG: o-succinylbenzoate--CoA ligase [Bacteroidota bacterium]